jgi:hypothetical protein
LDQTSSVHANLQAEQTRIVSIIIDSRDAYDPSIWSLLQSALVNRRFSAIFYGFKYLLAPF